MQQSRWYCWCVFSVFFLVFFFNFSRVFLLFFLWFFSVVLKWFSMFLGFSMVFPGFFMFCLHVFFLSWFKPAKQLSCSLLFQIPSWLWVNNLVALAPRLSMLKMLKPLKLDSCKVVVFIFHSWKGNPKKSPEKAIEPPGKSPWKNLATTTINPDEHLSENNPQKVGKTCRFR